MNPWRVEPVAITGAALMALHMCCTYWWHFSPQQTAEFMLSATAILGSLTRQSVTSPATIHAAGETVRGIAARAAESTKAAKVEEQQS